MPSQEYKITSTQPQSQTIDAHSYYSSHTSSRGDCCRNCSDDDKRCCSCMCTTGFAIAIIAIIIKFAC